jgi:hypothetical protein
VSGTPYFPPSPYTDAQAGFVECRDLYSIPTDLRVHLEDCLGEDASPAVLEQHMPRIKQVIYKLLIGLKARQEPYRLAVAEKRKASR